MKFGQVIDYEKERFFFKYHGENGVGKLVPDLFLFLVKKITKYYDKFIW